MATSSKSNPSTTRKPRSSPKKRTAPRSKKKPAAPPCWQDWLVTRKPVGVGTRGAVAIRWIQANCIHTDDRWLGKPFRLLTWQKLVILALFTVRADGLRVIRWALIGIAKKNGKTELLAALALFFAFGPSGPDGQPEPSALVIIAAGSDDQADKLFNAAVIMASNDNSPLKSVLECFESEITCSELPGSKIKRVAAAAKKTSSNLDGPNIYVVICDELHCWEGPQAKVVWDTLTNGGATRLQPMVLQITTAGFDKESICGQQYSYGKAQALLEPGDEGYDPAYFFWWVEPPDGAKIDHRDPASIVACNPSFGSILGLEFYLDQLTKKTEAVFRRYFLNEWTEAEETWLGHGTWEHLSVGPFEFDPTLNSWLAIDAATKHDSTALVQGQWHACTAACVGWKERDNQRAAGGVVMKLRVRAQLWECPLDPRTQRPLEGWKLPINEVENELRARYTLLGPRFRSCSYDSAHFHRTADQLENEGLPMEDFPQTDARMVPAAQTVFQLIVDELLEHDGDPDFARHMRNAVAVQARGGNGGWRLAKGKNPKQKMDAAVTLAMVALDATSDDGGDGEGTDLW